VSIAPVTGDERIAEIARMAGGDREGEAARAYARDLIATRGNG
jgi:DNA repair ATPase RecN